MDPSTAALEVAKLIPVAKSAFDHLKTRMKTAEDIPKLIDLYDAFQTLRDENMRLREELRQRDARAAYTRKKMGVAVVRVQVEPDGTAGPPCCPKCNDDDGDFQCREQRGRPMTLIVVGHRAAAPLLDWQTRLSPVQRLHGALFVQAEHYRVRRWIQVEPHHIV